MSEDEIKSFEPKDTIMPFGPMQKKTRAVYGEFIYGTGVRYGESTTTKVGEFSPKEKIKPFEMPFGDVM